MSEDIAILLSLDQIAYDWLDSQSQLESLCQRWQAESACLALDTEFERTRTFYPRLALMQIADGQGVYLLDPLSHNWDWSPLRQVLQAPNVTKVLHAASEDLELFYSALGATTRGLVDTQLIAGFFGLGMNLGYAKLVEQGYGILLSKALSRSDWFQRPLSLDQCRYAAADVFYLWHLYQSLAARFAEDPRWTWMLQDCSRQADPARYQPNDALAYRRVKHAWRLSGKPLQLLQVLAAWRDQEARSRDRARNFVVQEEALLALAEKQPSHLAALAGIASLGPAERQRYGDQLLKLIARTLASDAPPPASILRVVDVPGYGRLQKLLKEAAQQAADRIQIPVELLANRRLMEACIKANHLQQPLPLSGWRREQLLPAFSALCPEALTEAVETALEEEV